MLVLSREDILKVFSMRDAIEADKEAFVMHSRGLSEVPLRSNLDVGDGRGQCLFMPAYVKGINSPGIKIVSVFPENAKIGKPAVPATMVLLNGDTGEVSALLEGTTLTQIRTGAIAGAATELLARKDASIGALFGTGGQAPSQMEALLTVRSLREIRIFDVDAGRARKFSEDNAELAERFDARLVVASSPDQAVDGADVITTVTTSKRPVFNGKLIKKGAHINGVGAYTPQMQEMDTVLLERADRVFVDNREAVFAEAGDFLIPMKEGRFSTNDVAGELGELIEKRVQGRTSDDQITVFKTVGFATLDVVAAYRICAKAAEVGVGSRVDL